MTRKKNTFRYALLLPLLLMGALFVPSVAAAAPLQSLTQLANTCGAGSDAVEVAVNIGCRGEGNAISDAIGGIIRFLVAGVGVVVTLMIAIGGVQYIASSGNPQAIEAAKKKIFHAVEALLLFLFMAAILNFIIPGGLL